MVFCVHCLLLLLLLLTVPLTVPVLFARRPSLFLPDASAGATHGLLGGRPSDRHPLREQSVSGEALRLCVSPGSLWLLECAVNRLLPLALWSGVEGRRDAPCFASNLVLGIPTRQASCTPETTELGMGLVTVPLTVSEPAPSPRFSPLRPGEVVGGSALLAPRHKYTKDKGAPCSLYTMSHACCVLYMFKYSWMSNEVKTDQRSSFRQHPISFSRTGRLIGAATPPQPLL